MKFEKTVVDGHFHLYNVYDAYGKDFLSAVDEMQSKHNLKAINIASIPTHQRYGVDQNIICALYKLHNKTAYAYGGIAYPEPPVEFPLPDGMDSLTQYKELMEIGFDGIKFLESKPAEQKEYGVCINHPFYNDIFEKCANNNTPILWHVADPDTFWDIKRIPPRFIERGWFYGDGTYLSLEETYGQVFEILDRHPELKVTFAHFFFYSDYPDKLEKLFQKYPNVCIDLAPGSEMFKSFNDNRDFYIEFFTKYADRIIYGTDASFMENTNDDYERYQGITDSVYKFLTTDEVITIYGVSAKGLKLPDEVTSKILNENFIKRTGDKPKEINKSALKKYIQKYYDYIKDEKLKEYINSIEL